MGQWLGTTLRITLGRSLGLSAVLGLGCAGDDVAASADGTTGDATSTGAGTNPSTGASTTPSTGAADTGSASSSGGADSDTSAGLTSTGMPGSTTSDGSTSAGSTSTDSGSTGASLCADAVPIADLDSAVAILVADKPPFDPTGGGMSSAGGEGGDGGGDGLGPDPDDLRIRLANVPLTCGDPDGDFACENFEKWRVSISVPSALVGVGSFDFSELNVGVSTIGPGMSPDDCPGGFGGGVDGTLVIESIGPGGVVGCLLDTDFGLFDVEGSFTADNCSDL